MSKIFIFGDSGRVATELIKDLAADGSNSIVAAARHPENVVKLANVTAEKLDLHADVDDILEQIKGSDVVYFTAGSRGKDLIQTDALGAIKTMIASEKAGIKRYVMLSSMYSLDLDNIHIIPGMEDAGTGKINLDYTTAGEVSIPDVAQVLADVIKYPNTARN